MDEGQRNLLRSLKGKRLVFESDAHGKVTMRVAEREQTELQCSFCGKNESEVAQLIAGSTVYICNECVMWCAAFLREEGLA